MLAIILASAMLGHWLDQRYNENGTAYYTAFITLAGVVVATLVVVRDLLGNRNNT